MMKLSIPSLVSVICLYGFGFGTGPIREPMQADFKNSASYRWLAKTVLDSHRLDDMESLSNWSGFTTGGPTVVDARVVSKTKDTTDVTGLSLTAERTHSGSQSLLMSIPTRLPGPGPKNGRGWGRAGIRRHFDGEDWTASNRLSLWIYPDLPGFYTTALDMRIFNDGAKKLPALFGQEGETSIILQNHQWNHVVWEIGNVARDKVTGFEASYGLSGSYPGEAESIRFFFDQLDLERVDADKIEGWDVWPGRISYSHAGYQTGAIKTAIAGNADAKEFSLIDQSNGETVLSKPIATTKTALGSFQVMDFSEIRKPGSYMLRAGSLTTHPFPIAADVWEESIWKALNFFYAERCGMEIPGIHGICHRDWLSVHNDKKIVINGGWHDAGDLTQGLGNTGEIDYALFSMAERLQARNENPALYQRILEEARWGLDWILKTSFGDGYRDGGSISSRRTNGILGDDDDIVSQARNSPMDNFVAAAAEAIAYRVLKDSDPRLAAYSLKMAQADWKFAVEGMAAAAAAARASGNLWTGTLDSDNIEYEIGAEGILASVDLWKATGDKQYEDKAVALSQDILHSQQRSRPNWDIPFTGFFYTSPQKDRVLHFVHRGRDQAHILALTELCKAFPDHPDWMRWYSAVTLYSEYLKGIAKYTEPYSVMPASIYNDTEYLKVPESRKESFKKQVLNGIPLGQGHYLRLFPVWMDYRGHFGTILPQAQSLVNAAHLRGDLASAQLSEHQLEWIIGRNPFSESTMYGEGHDFVPLYTPSSGDMVGALPVGIQTREENDAPYWPVQSTWTYKEIWVHPVSGWVWFLRDLSGPALVEGQATAAITFKELTTGQETTIRPDGAGRFRTNLPEGRYSISTGNGQQAFTQTRTFLPTGTYTLDLRPERALDFEGSSTSSSQNEITIKLTASGNGTHRFTLRTDNLSQKRKGAGNPPNSLTKDNTLAKEITLTPGQPVVFEWHLHINSAGEPWTAVIIPDGDLSQHQELTGAAWNH
ncbi:MAG: glycoside hydrolase family 9 protein [Puia sp.]|nr:glycoside hydrolase family 9 protein [Puia sp.]